MTAPERESVLFRFFVGNPAFAILVMLLMILAGFMAYESMVKESMPDLEIPQALVVTEWPGASPEQVEKEISTKIEKELRSLKGLRRTRSGSMNSISLVSVEFRAEAALQESMQLLRGKLNEIEASLPRNAKKPTVEPVSISDVPIMTVALFGPADDAVLAGAARDVRKRLERIPGIKKATAAGYREEIVQIQLRPERLRALGIPVTLVKAKIENANFDVPWGRFENEDLTATVNLIGRFRDLEALERLPVARLADSRVVYLGEIANVRRDLAPETTRTFLSWRGGEFRKCATVDVYKLPGKDTLQLIDAAHAALEEARGAPEWPYSLEYRITAEESSMIWGKLLAVFNNGWQASLAVFVVLFVLMTWREALMAALSVPLTFLGVTAVLHALGYTMNELTIIGMVFALGMLVDDFILMMEGVHTSMFEKGLSIKDSQRDALCTYAVPSLAGSLTTIFVFFPLMRIGGIDGKFIRIIPVTAAVCLTFSYLISVFIDVPLCRFVMREGKEGETKTRADVLLGRVEQSLVGWLERYVVFNKPVAVAWNVAAVALFVASVASTAAIPSTLYPAEDGRKLGVCVELAPDALLPEAQAVADRVGELLRSKPYLESVVECVGQKSPYSLNAIAEQLAISKSPHLVGFTCLFTPRGDRDRLAFEYVEDLRIELEALLKTIPGAALVMSVEKGGTSAEDPIQIDIVGNDMDVLRGIAADVGQALSLVPGVAETRDNLGSTRLDVSVLPRREAIEFYGVDEADMAMQVRLAMTDDEVGKFQMPGTADDLELRLGTAWPSRHGQFGGPTTWEEIELVSVASQTGRNVPIGALTEFRVDEAPLALVHKDGHRAVTVMAKNRGRTVGQILSEFEPRLKAMQREWPEDCEYAFSGETEASAETYASVRTALVIAIALVFATLVLTFGSYLQPMIIMLTIPFGLIGAFGGFFLLGIPFSFPAMVGVISLVGIAVNNAIVMIETMNGHRQAGLSVKAAAARGVADRLRPILSTTLTTIVGLAPLAWGSPLWMPLCMAIMLGLISSTVVAMVVVPGLYLLLTPERENAAPIET